MSDWEDCIGSYAPIGTKKFKDRIGDVLYRMIVKSLEYVAKVKFLSENISPCECYFNTIDGVEFCCGKKKASEKCEMCKEMESAARSCYYCKKYGKFFHFDELDDKDKRRGKTKFVTVGEELKIALWLSLTKMLREVEMAFESEEAKTAPSERQVSFVVNWCLDNDVESPVIPIITGAGEDFRCLCCLKDDFGLTLELIDGIRKSIPNKLVEFSTINTLAVKYVEFLKAIALMCTRVMWHKRQLFSTELYCTLLDMLSDRILEPDYLTMIKFSDMVQEYINIIRDNKKKIKMEEIRKKKEKESTDNDDDTENVDEQNE